MWWVTDDWVGKLRSEVCVCGMRVVGTKNTRCSERKEKSTCQLQLFNLKLIIVIIDGERDGKIKNTAVQRRIHLRRNQAEAMMA